MLSWSTHCSVIIIYSNFSLTGTHTEKLNYIIILIRTFCTIINKLVLIFLSPHIFLTITNFVFSLNKTKMFPKNINKNMITMKMDYFFHFGCK